jgi:hypothetical protein
MLRGLLGLAAVALLGFPVVAGSLVAADTLAGEGRFLYEATYEQRALLTSAIGDYTRALPFAAVAVIVLAIVGLVFGRVRGARVGGWVTVVLATVCGLILGLLATGGAADPSAWALTAAGGVVGLLLRFPVGWILAARAPRGA